MGRYDGELALITYDIAIKLFSRRLGAAGTGAAAALAVGGATTN